LEKLWKALEAVGDSGLEPKREFEAARRPRLYRDHNKWVIVVDEATYVSRVTRIA
jgi:hypothetical protein